MTEHTFVKSINTRIKRNAQMYVWKINDLYAGGVPDAWYCGNKNNIFVEFKFIKALPKKDATLIDFTTNKFLSPNQQSWITKRYYQNISTAVIIGSNEGILICPGVTWTEPVTRTAFMNAHKPEVVAKWITAFCSGELMLGSDYVSLYHPNYNRAG